MKKGSSLAYLILFLRDDGKRELTNAVLMIEFTTCRTMTFMHTTCYIIPTHVSTDKTLKRRGEDGGENGDVLFFSMINGFL